VAKMTSNTETDLTVVGLNDFLVASTGRTFQNNVNASLGGVKFADKFTIKIVEPDFNYNVAFYGQNLTFDAQAKMLSSGTISGYEQVDLDTGEFFRVTGMNVSASSFMDALKSVGTADDFAVIKAMFAGNDTMLLSSFVDDMHGYNGNDRMEGRGSRDVLSGDTGNDTLIGGAAADRLSGGAGADRFQYANAGEGKDVITDFSSADFMVFEGSAFGLGSYAGKLKSANFVARASGHVAGADDFFIFDQMTDQLWFDSNASAAGGARMIADLNNFNLLASDILIV
jgi:Ca2+-binding RTX toxin-like protein